MALLEKQHRKVFVLYHTAYILLVILYLNVLKPLIKEIITFLT